MTYKSAMIDFYPSRSSMTTVCGFVGLLIVVLICSPGVISAASGQRADKICVGGETIQGTVLDGSGKPAGGAVVRLDRKLPAAALETRTNVNGAFAFSSLSEGSYQLRADKAGLHTGVDVTISSENCVEHSDLVLQVSDSRPLPENRSDLAARAMEFADEPKFTIAGVTDWTAVGGHGSDSTLRTSESLATETVNLKPAKEEYHSTEVSPNTGEDPELESRLRAAVDDDPNRFDANHQLGEFYLRLKRARQAIPLLESAYEINPANGGNLYDLALAYEADGNFPRARECVHKLLMREQNGDAYRLAGELDEKAGDPLSAVHEFEQATKLDPSEQNYFEWGSELLLHRAIWQAQEVFRQGADAYPISVRMQTAMGTALFGGARYEEAAIRLCKASDLNPADPNPYNFMGQIEMAAPNSLVCVEPKLARFAGQEPENPIANYMYAMSLLKRQEHAPDRQVEQQAEALLTKAISIDPKCSAAYLQLGVIAASHGLFPKAISFYKQAIQSDPNLADSYYRLGVAYDRSGQPIKAKEEFQLHDKIKQQQSQVIEQQRKDVKQFLIVLSGGSGVPKVQ